MSILIIIYACAGYWAVGKTIFANRIIVSNKIGEATFLRLFFGILFGWCLIPVAIIKQLFFKK